MTKRVRNKLDYRWLFFTAVIFLLCQCQERTPLVEDLGMKKIRIQIAPNDFQQIKQKRAQALALGYLESSGDDFQAATIHFEGQDYSAEVRLKGDWLDHLKGDKWSWRVKLSDAASILQADQFSLQNPETRFFLHEWVFHKLLEQENLLTPRYEFLELWVNDQYKGIYAFESHFTEALLARQKRSASVILKFNEEGFWQAQDYRLRYGKNVAPSLPDFEAANVEPFQKNKIRNDSTLLAAFDAGRARLEQLRNPQGTDQRLQAIDIDYWARFFAIIDLTEAYHALRWHNMRWYYHPQTSQLYPIGFDGYGSNGIYYWFKKTFLGQAKGNGNKVYFTEEYFLFALFNSKEFQLRYQHYLLAYSEIDFVRKFLQEISPELSSIESALQQEFAGYEFRQDSLLNRAKHLHQTVQSYGFETAPPFVYTIYQPLFDGCETSVPLSAIGLKAVRSAKPGIIDLYNYYCKDIKIEASGPKRHKPLHERQTSVILPPFDINTIPPAKKTITIPESDQFLFYSIEGVDYWFREKINPWPLSPPNFVEQAKLLLDTVAFELKGTLIQPTSRQIALNSVQVIPRGYQLKIPAGTRISLNSKASIMVYGNANWTGTRSSPIEISSDDQTGRGLHFIDVDTLQLAHVTMSNNQTFRDRGLFLNGAMTCWAEHLSLDYLTFHHIHAEDALNVIHSPDVDLKQLHFNNCSGDGLDIDFSAGSLQNASFRELGGDGLDLSGSTLSLSVLDFSDITDKALSIGEKTTVEAEDISVRNAHIGVAVKDESRVRLRQGRLEHCQFGMTVFNKKNYFGPAQLYAEDCQLNVQVQVPLSLENAHTLVLDGTPQKVTHLSGELARLFYPPAH